MTWSHDLDLRRIGDQMALHHSADDDCLFFREPVH